MDDRSQNAAPARTKCYGNPGALAPLDPNSSYAKVLELIEPGATVLDVGCGAGELDRYLAERGHRVWAVDANADALALAAPYCVEVRQADLETADLADVFGPLRFDAIVFADSLEHLREPWRTLESARELLSENGTVIASIPNFAHAAVRLAVVSGSMPYRKSGILDDTHLRFFTRSGVEALFLECGFHAERILRTVLPFAAPNDLVPDVGALHVPEAIERLVREDPESETLQFVVRAIRVPGPWDTSAMRSHVHDLQAQLAEQTIGLANRERDTAALREHVAAVERERDALAAEVTALHAASAALQAQADGAAREAAARAQTLDAIAQRERDEAGRLTAALADARRDRDDAAARAEAEAARAAAAEAAVGETAAGLAAAERRAAEAEARAAQGLAEAEARATQGLAEAEARAAQGLAAAEARAAEALAAAESARAELQETRARSIEAASRLRVLELRAQEGERRAAELELAVAAEQAARGQADEALAQDLASAGDRLAEARSDAQSADAAARAARADAATLRAELTTLRRRAAEAEEERDELRRREAEREALRRLLDDHEIVASAAEAVDGRQLWPVEGR